MKAKIITCIALFFLAGLLFSLPTFSENNLNSSNNLNKSKGCGQDLLNELRAMKEAQNSIQNSLISNHTMFASVLESYADALAESAGKAHKMVTLNMHRSAESIQNRGLQAQKTAQKLKDSTEQLAQKILNCLSQ